MPVPTSILDLSTVTDSNSPAGADVVGGTLDNHLRALAGILRRAFSRSADVASASTVTLPAEGLNVWMTGTATISGFAPSYVGRQVTVTFAGTVTLVHGANFILPGLANIAVQGGDSATFVNESSTSWRCVNYCRISGRAVVEPMGVPLGGIIMWSGSLAAIPAGFALCDGQGGRPDLRGRFIIGGHGGLGVGSTGGVGDHDFNSLGGGAHSHTTDAQGAHDHGAATAGHALQSWQIPAHNHGIIMQTGGDGGSGTDRTFWVPYRGNNAFFAGPDGEWSYTEVAGGGEAHAHGIPWAGTHSHSVSWHDGHAHRVTFDNRPPWYALAYIQRVA